LLLLSWRLLILTSFNSLNPSQYKLSTIVIDAGHGGKDPGARGKISWEKDIALSISLELGRILKENIPALNIIYTRKEDKFLTLYFISYSHFINILLTYIMIYIKLHFFLITI